MKKLLQWFLDFAGYRSVRDCLHTWGWSVVGVLFWVVVMWIGIKLDVAHIPLVATAMHAVSVLFTAILVLGAYSVAAIWIVASIVTILFGIICLMRKLHKGRPVRRPADSASQPPINEYPSHNRVYLRQGILESNQDFADRMLRAMREKGIIPPER
jgi:hypothetical protein